jgi:hypothetical protein
VDPGLDHEPFGVHEDVALAPAHLLAAVEAPLLAAYPGRLYRLAVHYPCAGLGLASELLPQPPAQDAVQTLPKPVNAPLGK